MSLIELALIGLVGATAPAVVQTGSACPATNHGGRLASVLVYDGPVGDQAILVPDATRNGRGGEVSRWDVRYIYDAGRQVHLQCTYRRRPALVVRVAHRVAGCRYTNGPATRRLSCA